MCHKFIETYSCGHKEESPIPCNDKLDGKVCNAPPEELEDALNDLPQLCPKCKARKEDDDAFEDAMKKIAEDPNLAPEPKTAVQPAGNLGFLKQRTKWSKCGHCDSPRELNIERESEKDPIWLDHEERGSCFMCSQTPESLLHTMRLDGKLDGEDPWGALNAPPEAAASGSGSSKPRAQAGSYGGDLGQNPALGADYDTEEDPIVPVSRPSSPDQLPTLTKGKGKSRAVKPEETYESRYGRAEPAEPDSEHEAPALSGDEKDDEFRPPQGKAPEYIPESESEFEDSGDDDDGPPPPPGRKPERHVQGNSREESPRGHISRSSSFYSQDEDDAPEWSAPPPGGPPPRDPDGTKTRSPVEEEETHSNPEERRKKPKSQLNTDNVSDE